VIAAIIGGIFLIINTMVDNNNTPSIVITAIIPAAETDVVNFDPENIKVIASKCWQTAGIQVKSGEELTITVIDGSWTYQKGKKPYNNGEGDPSYICADITLYSQCVEPMPDFPIGGLIGQIGSQKFWIGNEVTITINKTGILQLRINDGDDGLYDNDGTLQVRVVIN
jgi:hypothetical protein